MSSEELERILKTLRDQGKLDQNWSPVGMQKQQER